MAKGITHTQAPRMSKPKTAKQLAQKELNILKAKHRLENLQVRQQAEKFLKEQRRMEAATNAYHAAFIAEVQAGKYKTGLVLWLAGRTATFDRVVRFCNDRQIPSTIPVPAHLQVKSLPQAEAA